MAASSLLFSLSLFVSACGPRITNDNLSVVEKERVTREEIAKGIGILPIQAEAILLILLVLVGHGLVWDFMVRRPPGGTHVRGSDG